MQYIKNYQKIFFTVKKSYSLLIEKERTEFKTILLIFLFASIFDTIALSSVYPLVSIVSQPSLIETNKNFIFLHSLFKNIEINYFILLLIIITTLLLSISAITNLYILKIGFNFSVKIQTRIAKSMINNLIRSPYEWFVSQNSNQLIRVLYSDIEFWGRDCIFQLANIGKDLLSIIVPFCIIFFSTSNTVKSILFIIIGLAIFLITYIQPIVNNSSKRDKKETQNLISIASDVIGGIKDIKFSKNKEIYADQFTSSYQKKYSSTANFSILKTVPGIILRFLGQISLLFLMIILYQSNDSPGLVTGELALMAALSSKIIPALSTWSALISNINIKSPWVISLLELYKYLKNFEPKNTLPNALITSPIYENWSKLTIKNLCFKYDQTKNFILNDINLEITKGGSYGLVGFSGSGKTTFIDNLVGLLSPSQGEILVDGVNIRNSSLDNWYKEIGYVSQNPYIADTTIRKNISMWNSEVNKNEEEKFMRDCLKQVNILDFIEKLPDGIDTEIGEKGAKLSGGQCQRIAIARVLFQKPSLIIFDEATNSLDNINANYINETINIISQKMTTIIIAHNMSLIKNCKEIIVLNNSKVVSKGKYEDLKRSCDIFKSLIQSD